MEVESSNPVEPSTAAELSALVDQAQNGDAGALPRINQILDETPAIWKHLGDIGGLAERAWIGVLAEKNAAVVESLARTLASMRADLSGENPSAIERVLVDQAVLCWLQVKALEFNAANMEKNAGGKTNRAHIQLELAHRRHLSALRALTDLRRLAPGAMATAGELKIFEKQTQKA
ncbi:MAG TPA: hypothetical protein VGP68_01590 [Gemmataceae bacterium]|jgi:hypothetical protein|nr:hypothetical protein [Gemmataceae bacterium]